MEEIQNFYLKIMAELHLKQTVKLSKERLLPQEYVLCKDKKVTRKTKSLCKKSERQRKKIEKGYYKGIDDSIKIIQSIYKKALKCSLKES